MIRFIPYERGYSRSGDRFPHDQSVERLESAEYGKSPLTRAITPLVRDGW
jgi:hypothetical protein